MVYKPKKIGPSFGDTFADQIEQVSISIDTFDYSDTSAYRVFFQVEPEEIIPHTAQRLLDRPNFYDLILTWDERVLTLPNAVKFLYGTCRWSEDPKDEADMTQKAFSVSYLTSSKVQCAGHYFRHEIFKGLPDRVGSLTVSKHMSPPEIPCKRPMLYPFQFSIVMENVRHNNWITEKLIDCLVSRTLPIYWGAPNVGEYFRADGILSFSTYPELIGILESLTPEFYQNHLSAVEENLHRAMKYTNLHTRVDEEIRRRLSGNHIRTPEHIRSGQEVCESVPRQQSTQPRRIHRPIREGIL